MNKNLSLTAMLWIVAAGFFMQTLDATIVNTALPSMAASLNEQALNMQPVIVAYSLTMALLTPASGWLGDRYGTRRVYFSAILIFALGSLFCAMSLTLNQLIAARVLQGVGGSMLLPIGRLAVLRNFPNTLYLSAITMTSIAGQMGILLGPVLGGWLTQSLSWHWIFLINIPIGLIGCIAILVFLPGEEGIIQKVRFDWAGFVLLATCMTTFSIALDGEGLLTIAMLGLSAAAVWAYIQLAKRKANPLFSLSLFKRRSFSLGLAGNLIARIGGSAVVFLMPLLFQLELGLTPFQSGMMMLPIAVASVMVKRIIAPLIHAYGYGNFLVVNTLLVGASIIAFVAISETTPMWFLVLQLGLFGAVNSMQNGAMNSVTLKDLGARQASSGNGLFSMVQMLAIGIGVAVGGTLVKLLSSVLPDAILAFRITFVLVGLVTLASALVFAALRTTLAESAVQGKAAKSVEK